VVLTNVDLDWSLLHHQDALVAGTVPEVDDVVLAAAQRPYREVESEWGRNLDLELTNLHRPLPTLVLDDAAQDGGTGMLDVTGSREQDQSPTGGYLAQTGDDISTRWFG
jgi:hypothetical protein